MTIANIILLTATAGLLTSAIVRAYGQVAPAMSCCGDMTKAPADGTSSVAADNSALSAPVKSVYDYYLKIQAALANDSLTGVDENASAIATAVQSDAKSLPAEAGKQAGTLAKAKDLTAARAAFKPLSDSLIKYLADNNAKTSYVQVYCPMARASWLQAGRNVRNPYLGQSMSSCGVIKK